MGTRRLREMRLASWMAGLFCRAAAGLAGGWLGGWTLVGQARSVRRKRFGFGGGDAGEAEGLGAAGVTGEELDAEAGDVEALGEEGDERGVRAAVGGWGGEGDLEGVGVSAGDGVAFGAGMDADGEDAAAVGGAKDHG